MASIQTRRRRDGTVAYRVLYRQHGRQHTATFDSPIGAQALVRDIDRHGIDVALELLDARAASDRPGTTVADQVRSHVDTLTGITDGTRHSYRTWLDRDIAPRRLGSIPLDQLGRGDVEAWITWLSLERGLAPASIATRHTLLSAAIKRAVDGGTLARNPCAGVKLPRKHRDEEVAYIEPRDFALLINVTPAHYRPLVSFLYGTGTRFGEATALQVRDVEFDTPPRVQIRRSWKRGPGTPQLGPPKTELGRRTVDISETDERHLHALVADRAPRDFVFTTTRGNPIEPSTFRKRIWAPIAAAVEAETGKHPTIHGLRHSHASNLIRAGWDITAIQRRLGHYSIQITSDLYGHVSARHAAGLAEAANATQVEAFPELEG